MGASDDLLEKEGHGQHRFVHARLLPGCLDLARTAAGLHLPVCWCCRADCRHLLPAAHSALPGRCSWQQTTAALLSLQLGWGLWLFPSSYARLGEHWAAAAEHDGAAAEHAGAAVATAAQSNLPQDGWYLLQAAALKSELGRVHLRVFAVLCRVAAGWVPALCITFALAVLTSYSGSLFSRLYQAVPTAGARQRSSSSSAVPGRQPSSGRCAAVSNSGVAQPRAARQAGMHACIRG